MHPNDPPDSSASATMAKHARQPHVRRLLSSRKSLDCGGCADEHGDRTCRRLRHVPLGNRHVPLGNIRAARAPSSGAACGGDPAYALDRPQGEHPARSSLSTSSFTMSTSAGQKVTSMRRPLRRIDITATQVSVQPTGSGGSAASSAAPRTDRIGSEVVFDLGDGMGGRAMSEQASLARTRAGEGGRA
jgi:hypothetical protein